MLEDGVTELLADVRSVPGVDECFYLVPGEFSRVVNEKLLSRWWSSAERHTFGISRGIDVIDSHSVLKTR